MGIPTEILEALGWVAITLILAFTFLFCALVFGRAAAKIVEDLIRWVR